MNVAALARSAYADVSGPIKSERRTEYQIFAKVTRRLAQASGTDFVGYIELAEALHDNRRLWNILASDVSSGDNGLPAELRAQIFYLAEFIEDYSRKILDKQVDTSALIEINTTIMRGLRASELVSK